MTTVTFFQLVIAAAYAVVATLGIFLGVIKRYDKGSMLYFFIIAFAVFGSVVVEVLTPARFLIWNITAICLVVLYLYANGSLLHYDALTGFHNRFFFEKDLKSPHHEETIFIFDINKLKLVNDTQGHQAGDALIKKTAEAIAASFNGFAGKNYRIGGDEFVHICPTILLDTQIAGILTAIERQLGKGQLAAGVCRGEKDKPLSESFKTADNAMYQCKAAQRQEHP